MSNICEFKKGNWLFRKKASITSSSDELNEAYEVNQIDNITESLIVFSQNGIAVKIHVGDILPIPLTERILSDSGFELLLAKDGIIVYSKDFKQGKIFVSNMHGVGWKLSSDLDNPTYFDVPYVHLMQNKYRRLTQQEWKVNLSNISEYLLLD